MSDDPPRTGYTESRGRVRSGSSGRGRRHWYKDRKKRLYAPYGHDTTIRKYGHLLTWSEMTPHERGRTSRRIMGGHTRNRYWRAKGFPNLTKAREMQALKREERLKAGVLTNERLRRIVAGLAQPKDAREARDLELFRSGQQERKPTVLLGDIPVAGLCDPAYLMRREMRILDVMGRCPG